MLHRIGAILRTDCLEDLPDAQPFECLRLDSHRLRAEIGEDGRGSREEKVAREDRHRIAPAGIRARCSAAQRSLIHDIVVIERCEVREFD